jgi:hypothetical protein
MSLRKYTDTELKKELEKRQQVKIDKPVPLKEMDFTPVIKMCKDLIDQIEKENYYDEDLDSYIVEETLIAVFGKDVWKYINLNT